MSGHFWRSGALPAALGSLGSLGAQAVMALFLLRLFEPQAVGIFSVIAQVAFGLATLALAQSPMSLLANQHLPALPAARQALLASLRRWVWLAPLAALALWWSARGTSTDTWLVGCAWALAIGLTQMVCLLAQSLSLRIHSPLSIAFVRLVPPVLAATMAGVGALWLDWRSSNVLTAAALSGYAAGALWLSPLLQSDRSTTQRLSVSAQADQRSERLKFLHTLSDVFVATALAVHWTSVYGAAEAGCLLVLLRVMGFVPALLSTAWAQVVLSRPLARRPSSALAALAGCVSIWALGLTIGYALQAGWLSARWSGLEAFVWPVALWQTGACLIASASHRPFRHGRSVSYTRQCMALNAVQMALVFVPPVLGWPMQLHLWALAGSLGLALFMQAIWASQLAPENVPL